MADAKERCGLVVVGNTLRSDWSSHTGNLEDIRGAVWIEVTPRCNLQDNLIEEIAELLAITCAHETLEHEIDVTAWKVERVGDRIEVSVSSFEYVNPAPGQPQPLGYLGSPTDMYGFGR